jgi:hypothetical protein
MNIPFKGPHPTFNVIMISWQEFAPFLIMFWTTQMGDA